MTSVTWCRLVSRSLAALLFSAAVAIPNFCNAEDVASPGRAPLSEGVLKQERAGDALLVGIPLAALAATFLIDRDAVPDRGPAPSPLNLHLDADTILRMNGHPRHDLMLAMGRTLAATYTLKYSVDEERPNGADSHSFPSGHSSVTFAGAEFIRKEYGWGWGAPAYALASFVGYSRVRAQDHYTADVVAGAAIGIMANHDLHEFFTPFGRLDVGPTLTQSQSMMDTPWREENVTQLAPAPSVGVSLHF